MGSLPAALRPTWSGASFLLYAGAVTTMLALGALFGSIADLHGSAALAGWSALSLAALVATALASRRTGRPVVAGLAAFVTVGVTGVLAGSLLHAAGLTDGVVPFDRDLELAPLLVELAVLTAALAAARVFQFPLLLLAAEIAKTVFVLDTTAGVLGPGTWVAIAALLLGLAELASALALDRGDRRPWAFWKHVAAALLIGGGSVWVLEGSTLGWVAIGLLALGYLVLARSLVRSSWAVVGALGLMLVTSHFAEGSDVIFGIVPFARSGGGGDGLELWQTALVYVGLGIAYVLLGQLMRQPTLYDQPPD